MHVCFYFCSVINICSSFSSFSLLSPFLSLSRLVSSFYSYRSDKWKESIILLLLSFLFLFSLSFSLFFFFFFSQPKILPASVHTHIYQSEEMRVLTRRRFFFFFFLYWPNLAPILLLSWFFYSLLHMPTYKNRVCVYIHTHKKESMPSIYIEEQCTILSTHSSISLLPLRLILIYIYRYSSVCRGIHFFMYVQNGSINM